jgi:hypothetical protein
VATLSFKVSSGNLESYEALFLQLPDPKEVGPVDRLDLTFGDVTQVFPPAFALLAAYLVRVRDPGKRPLVTRRFGSNPQSAKLERVMDAFGFLPAVLGEEPPSRLGSLVLPLTPVTADSVPERVATAVIDALVAVAQPTRDAKEALFAILTDLVENVGLHARAGTPAFLCGQLSAQKRKLELVLADAGVGVRRSLEDGEDADLKRRLASGESALRLALEPGRSCRGLAGTGLGLFLASAPMAGNRGAFRITSGTETILVSREGEKHRTHQAWHGTVINLLINIDKLGMLADVGRKLPLPLGAEDKLVGDEVPGRAGEMSVPLRSDAPHPYLGSPAHAEQVAGRILELVAGNRIAVADFEGVTAVAPSWVQRSFGQVLRALGEDAFRDKVVVRGASEPLRTLIEAILERQAAAVPGREPRRRAAPTETAAAGSGPGEGEREGVAADAPAAEEPAADAPAADPTQAG